MNHLWIELTFLTYNYSEVKNKSLKYESYEINNNEIHCYQRLLRWRYKKQTLDRSDKVGRNLFSNINITNFFFFNQTIQLFQFNLVTLTWEKKL